MKQKKLKYEIQKPGIKHFNLLDDKTRYRLSKEEEVTDTLPVILYRRKNKDIYIYRHR